ncbi:tyrosine protein kinase [Pseudonocardia sp. CNS-139]|nr:tyrosine protein kinase [Pseudonocardia sp. CNS-139]
MIAGYDVVRQLGEGGHGRCYLVRPPSRLGLTDEFAVLKLFNDRVSELAYERGVRELRAVAGAGSGHVVRVFDAVLEASFGYAMEYFPLGSLAAPAAQLTRDDVLTALEHAARAAHALHEAGIAHGGVRPANVLLTQDAGGAVAGRLADPELCRVLTPGVALTGMARASALEFADPELLAGARPTRRTEVWSLGATIHRVLSGAGLHGELPDPQPLVVIRRLLTTRPQVHPGLGPAEAQLVHDCIADGDARLRTAAEVADRVAALRG